MRIRDFGDRRTMRRPAIDTDGLTDTEAPLDGELSLASVRYVGGDFADAEVEGEIGETVLSNVCLSGAHWQPITLADVRLTGCDVSNAIWSEVTARRVEVLSCRATGWGLSLGLSLDVYIADTRLDYATIKIVRTKGLTVFEGCSFTEARIGGDLSTVLFRDCDFSGAEFVATAAREADLHGSELVGARGLATLRGAHISSDQSLAIAPQLAHELGFHID